MKSGLSVIIPALNEERYLPLLLDSLQKQTYAGDIEIIIVDGQSADNTVAVAESYKKHFSDFRILESKRGIAIQRNLGVAKAKYDLLLFVDADIILPKHFIQDLMAKHITTKTFVATCFLWGAERDWLDYLSYLMFFPFFIPIGIIEHVTPGGMLFTNKHTHQSIGGFRETVKVGEDLDYSMRLKQQQVPYHYYFTPYALHSPRRLRKEGRLGFWMLYLKGYYYLKRHGVEHLHKHIDYEFGEYS